jgi:hypothetical protein
MNCGKGRSFFALMMEAVQTSETSVNSYQSTRRCNPEDSHLYLDRCLTEACSFGTVRVTMKGRGRSQPSSHSPAQHAYSEKEGDSVFCV